MLIVHLFDSYAHVNLSHFFSSSWCQGLGATSACGSSWTILLTFYKVLNQALIFILLIFGIICACMNCIAFYISKYIQA